MVNEILKQMNGCYVKDNAGKISTQPTNKVLLASVGVVKVKDLYLVYERWCREQGIEPTVKRTDIKPIKKIDKQVMFNGLFD